MRRGFQPSETASSATLGIIVASLIFGISLSAVVGYNSAISRQASTKDAIDLRSQAAGALDILLKSPGLSQAGESTWEKDADSASRIGLAEPERPNFLDYSKVLSLRRGGLTSQANGYLDYPDARAALGLDGYQFHLRSYPAIQGLDDTKWKKYRGINVAYVGHFESTNAGTSVSVTVSQSIASEYTEFAVKTSYLSGPDANIFQVTTDLDTGSSRAVQNAYTKQLAPGESDTTRLRFYNVAWPSGTGTHTIRVTVTGSANSKVLYDQAAHTVELTSGLKSYNLMMEPSKNYYFNGQPVKLLLDKYKADGSRYKTAAVSGTITVRDPLGLIVVENEPFVIAKTSQSTYPVDITGHPFGTYRATFVGGGQTVQANFTVRLDKLSSSASLPSADNVKERGYISALVETFDNFTYSAATPTGDVYRDTMDDMSTLGETLCTKYNMLIVGSRVTQSQLQGHFPRKVADCVDQGLTLIALGSDDKNIQWMKSIFGAGVNTATGGISTPDPTAAILHSPEELSYARYYDGGYTYKVDALNKDKFTHVIVKDTGGKTQEDTLAISNPGAYGDGTVLITSYIPRQILGPGDPGNDDEARKFLHNLMSQAYQMLFIDYGPIIPPGVPVGSTMRLAATSLPEIQDSLIEVRMVLYVWR